MTKPRKPPKPPERCSGCRGVGKIPNPDPEKSGFVTCPSCGGSGTQ